MQPSSLDCVVEWRGGGVVVAIHWEGSQYTCGFKFTITEHMGAMGMIAPRRLKFFSKNFPLFTANILFISFCYSTGYVFYFLLILAVENKYHVVRNLEVTLKISP